VECWIVGLSDCRIALVEIDKYIYLYFCPNLSIKSGFFVGKVLFIRNTIDLSKKIHF
jgi:hypothetical protein